jgi:hypothetical protein
MTNLLGINQATFCWLATSIVIRTTQGLNLDRFVLHISAGMMSDREAEGLFYCD